jgi:hypothetical protein
MATEKVKGYKQFRNGKEVTVTKHKRTKRSSVQKNIKPSKPFTVIPYRDKYGRFGYKKVYKKK